VTLSPDLQTAELTELLPYQITGGEQLSETVWLEQTFFYQRQEESWLLKPLPDDETYWGGWQNYEPGDNLTLIYPQRDEDFAIFLGDRFKALIAQICGDSSMECPNNFNLEIRLTREPASIQVLNDSISNVFFSSNLGSYHFSFPTPTLLGRPVDEAGNEALYHGYANWLAALMAFRYTKGATFPGGPVDEALAAWGLEPPPNPQQAVPIPQSIALPPIPFSINR
jgi:hypothetical protein